MTITNKLRAELAVSTATPDLPLAKYADDPVRFAAEVLRITPWSRQEELLRTVAGYPRVAVRSGHKVSKSCSAAILALWWVATRPGGRCIVTAPSGHQIRDIFWKELTKQHRRARAEIGGTLHRVPDRGLQFADGREVLGFSTDEPEKMSGISGENLLFIVDEASGVDEAIFEAIDGNRAGGGRIVMFSNPTKTSGYFYEAFTRRAEHWTLLHISSEESPNVAAGRAVVPGLATREWIEEKREEYGADSAQYFVRVRGDFPTHADNGIIGVSLVEESQKRWHALGDPLARFKDSALARANVLHLGVDVARFGGDESVIFLRRGNLVIGPYCYRGLDSVDLAGRVMAIALEHRARHLMRRSRDENFGLDEEYFAEEVPVVAVDVIGIGSGVFDALKRDKRVQAIAVDVSTSPPNDDYARLRDFLWFSIREWLKAGGAIPLDAKLTAELVAPTYSFTVAQQIQVESKDEMRKKLKRSPDRADALALAIYEPPKKRARTGSSAAMEQVFAY